MKQWTNINYKIAIQSDQLIQVQKCKEKCWTGKNEGKEKKTYIIYSTTINKYKKKTKKNIQYIYID